MHSSLGDDVGVESVAEVNRVDVVTANDAISFNSREIAWLCRAFKSAKLPFRDQDERRTYHSKSLYMMVKKTCRNRLTALISTDNRYNQASPDIIFAVFVQGRRNSSLGVKRKAAITSCFFVSARTWVG